MEIKPIKKVKVGEQVFQQLKGMLLAGEWKQGDKLPSENELADMFDVSRITVRQALQRLGALGLVETRLGEGSFVKKLEVGETMNELIPTIYLGELSEFQVFEFREMIETGSARLAAIRADAQDIEKLRRILDRMIKANGEADYRQFSKADLEFHFEIGQITKNPLIVKTNSILQEVLMRSMDEVIDRMGCEPGIKYHKAILKAIEEHEPEKAMELMREHIGKNAEYFE